MRRRSKERCRLPERIADYDVIVLTMAQMDTEDTRYEVEDAVQNGTIFRIVYDEAHTALFDLAWMRQLIRLRQLRRRCVGFALLTGTLHVDLMSELAACLHSTIGSETPEAIHGSSPDRAVHTLAGADQFSAFRREWIQNRGVYRCKPTVPTYLRFGVQVVDSVDNEFYLRLALMAKDFLSRDSVEDLGASKIHILVGERPEVLYVIEALRVVLPDVPTCSLVGNSSDAVVDEFHKAWHLPQTLVAVTTTVGAQGLNNRLVDCVFWSPAYYGSQLALQGAARAGRKKQKSNVIMFHSPKEFDSQKKRNPPRKAMLPFQDAGVNMKNKNVAQCLRPFRGGIEVL